MTRIFLIAGAIGMILTQVLIFFYAPLETSMGITQKIFYVHLPLAWWGLIAFFAAFLASIIVLKSHNQKAVRISRACCEVGELLAVLTVITGMIWGKNAWGVWWTWDPRLTTALILCFMYAAVLLLNNLEMPKERKETLTAVTAILAFLDVPLVFISARIWRSIHPAVFTSKGAAMSPEMLVTVLFAITAFGIFTLGLISLRCANLALSAKLDDLSQQHFE